MHWTTPESAINSMRDSAAHRGICLIKMQPEGVKMLSSQHAGFACAAGRPSAASECTGCNQEMLIKLRLLQSFADTAPAHEPEGQI